jgi:hypothetical protein
MIVYVNLWGCGYAAHISSGNILYNLPQIHYIIGIETSNIVINQLSSPIRVLVSNLVRGMTAIELFPCFPSEPLHPVSLEHDSAMTGSLF